MSRRRKVASVQPHEVNHDEEEIPKGKYITITPKNDEQLLYMKAILNNNIIIVTGMSGSGKTCVAAGMGADFLRRNVIDQMIISRPCVGAENLGFIPGEIDNKLDPYLAPLFQQLSKFINVKQAIAQDKLILSAVSYMRGVTWENSMVIVDECQNLTSKQLKMIVTRYGENSKLVLIGDKNQSDLNNAECRDFLNFINKLRPVASDPYNKVAIVELKHSVRHYLIEILLGALEEGV